MKLLLMILAFGFGIKASGQDGPVQWTFSAKRTEDKTYEIHFTANMQRGWHLYSQVQPDDAIAIPTEFKVNANPLLAVEGKIKEVGELEKIHDENLGISANQYSGKVDFVQVVKLKVKVKTNLTGTVSYQTCDDKKCLPPKVVSFSIPIK